MKQGTSFWPVLPWRGLLCKNFVLCMETILFQIFCSHHGEGLCYATPPCAFSILMGDPCSVLLSKWKAGDGKLFSLRTIQKALYSVSLCGNQPAPLVAVGNNVIE